MTKKELQHLIIDYPEEWVEITKDQFDQYLELFDNIGGERIKCLYSTVYEKRFYYSSTIKDLLEAEVYQDFYLALKEDFHGGYAPDLEPITYYVNKNFETVIRTVNKGVKHDPLPSMEEELENQVNTIIKLTDKDIVRVHIYQDGNKKTFYKLYDENGNLTKDAEYVKEEKSGRNGWYDHITKTFEPYEWPKNICR